MSTVGFHCTGTLPKRFDNEKIRRYLPKINIVADQWNRKFRFALWCIKTGPVGEDKNVS